MDVVAFGYVEGKLGFWLKIRLFYCFSSPTSYLWCWWSLDLAMNRSFRAQESQMPATVRQRQQQVGSLRSSVMKEKEEELALFLEMRKREKERSNLLLLQHSEEFDAPIGADLWSPFCWFWFSRSLSNVLWLLQIDDYRFGIVVSYYWTLTCYLLFHRLFISKPKFQLLLINSHASYVVNFFFVIWY